MPKLQRRFVSMHDETEVTQTTAVHHASHFALSALQFLLGEYAAGRQPQDRDVTAAQAFLTELHAHKTALTVTPDPDPALADADEKVAGAHADLGKATAHRARLDHAAIAGVTIHDLDKADAEVKTAQEGMAEAQARFDQLTRDDAPLAEREAAQQAVGKAKDELVQAEKRQASPTAADGPASAEDE